MTLQNSEPRKVYLEPSWKLPVSYKHMTGFPPAGYEFVTTQNRDRLFKAAGRWSKSYDLLSATDHLFPTVLAMSHFRRGSKPPTGTALTWAHGHLVFRPEPWVVEVEYAHLLLGRNPKHLGKFRRTLERALASPYCKKIRCWSEAGSRSLTSGLNSHAFENKIALIYHAVPPKSFVKEPGTGPVKLIFVGSPNIKGQFEAKGGLEVLETFALLRQRYQDIELVIRSDVPAYLRKRYAGMDKVRIIDKIVPAEDLEQEFRSADIFLQPSHGSALFSIMDAMSYELPVVSIKAWANGEYVENGKTGLLAEAPQKVPYYYGSTHHPNFGTAEFRQAIRRLDREVVGELVQKVMLLIEDVEFRKKLGKAGRWEIEHGKFSIATRNEKLKRVFDEAIGEVSMKGLENRRNGS